MYIKSHILITKVFTLFLFFTAIYGCTAGTQTLQVPIETFPPNALATSNGITDTPIFSPPTSVRYASQPISAKNFSKLKLFTHINTTFPEKVQKILWLSRGDRLGLLGDDQIHLYTVSSFSPDGKVVLPRRRSIYNVTYMEGIGDVMLINQDGNLMIWNLSKSESIQTYSWLDADLTSAQIGPSANLIARSGVQIQDRKQTIEIIDLAGKVIQRLSGHENDVPVLDFSPDERFLVASAIGRNTSQNLALVWDISSGSLLYSLPDSGPDLGVVKFNHEGNQLAVTNGKYLRLWNMNGQSWINDAWEYNISESYISSITFALNDDLIIANTNKNTMLFINAQNGDLLEFPDKSKFVVDAILSPDNQYLAVLAEDGEISIWAVMND